MVGIGEERGWGRSVANRCGGNSDYRFFCYPGPDGFDLLLITPPVLGAKRATNTPATQRKLAGFRHSLEPCGESGNDREGQQQVLRVYFAGIHGSVRKLFSARIATLSYRYRKTHNQVIKAELDRLTAELERLPERWEFRAGS